MFIIYWIEWFMDNREMLSQIITPLISVVGAFAVLTTSGVDDWIYAVLLKLFKILGVYKPPVVTADSGTAYVPQKEFPKTKIVAKTLKVSLGILLFIIAIAFAIVK